MAKSLTGKQFPLTPVLKTYWVKVGPNEEPLWPTAFEVKVKQLEHEVDYQKQSESLSGSVQLGGAGPSFAAGDYVSVNFFDGHEKLFQVVEMTHSMTLGLDEAPVMSFKAVLVSKDYKYAKAYGKNVGPLKPLDYTVMAETSEPTEHGVPEVPGTEYAHSSMLDYEVNQDIIRMQLTPVGKTFLSKALKQEVRVVLVEGKKTLEVKSIADAKVKGILSSLVQMSAILGDPTVDKDMKDLLSQLTTD